MPNFLVWKFCGKAQFPYSFGPIARKYTETVPFHNISTPGNSVKLRHFTQCCLLIKPSCYQETYIQSQVFVILISLLFVQGRTGVMICAYLIYKGIYSSPDEAMKHYAAARTFNDKVSDFRVWSLVFCCIINYKRLNALLFESLSTAFLYFLQ